MNLIIHKRDLRKYMDGNELNDNYSDIKHLTINGLTEVGDYFLANNESLISIFLPDAKSIGDSFLNKNKILEEINLPKVEKIGSYFLYNNSKITSYFFLVLKKLKIIF